MPTLQLALSERHSQAANATTMKPTTTSQGPGSVPMSKPSRAAIRPMISRAMFMPATKASDKAQARRGLQA